MNTLTNSTPVKFALTFSAIFFLMLGAMQVSNHVAQNNLQKTITEFNSQVK